MDDVRWLVYREPARGQGMGAALHGVAAALTIAHTYGRRLCVAWKAFEVAFSGNHQCPPKSSYFSAVAGLGTAVLTDASFELWSFDHSGSAVEPTAIPTALLAGNRSVVVMSGDGGSVPLAAPHEFPYSPRPELEALLGPPRRTVAHLRMGDEHEAQRGLFRDPSALELLHAALPSDLYILSDSASVYNALCERRSCPPWRAVPHSIERDARIRQGGAQHRHRQTLQAWADWWTLRSATHLILHTPSSFSESALRFSAAQGCVLNDADGLAACVARALLSGSADDESKELPRQGGAEPDADPDDKHSWVAQGDGTF